MLSRIRTTLIEITIGIAMSAVLGYMVGVQF